MNLWLLIYGSKQIYTGFDNKFVESGFPSEIVYFFDNIFPSISRFFILSSFPIIQNKRGRTLIWKYSLHLCLPFLVRYLLISLFFSLCVFRFHFCHCTEPWLISCWPRTQSNVHCTYTYCIHFNTPTNAQITIKKKNLNNNSLVSKNLILLLSVASCLHLIFTGSRSREKGSKGMQQNGTKSEDCLFWEI